MSGYWKLTAPRYSDYHHTFINGEVEHEFVIPGVRCDSCRQTWMSASRVLPVECPTSVRMNWPSGPQTFSDFIALREAIRAAIPRNMTGLEIAPGNAFLPGLVRLPSRPRADFLWGSLGSYIVSKRVKELFDRQGFSGCAFFPAVIEKIGRREAHLPPPLPSSGEPEDIMHSAKDPPTPEIGEYFEMIVCKDSLRVPEAVPRTLCNACGFEDWKPPKRWLMDDSLWTGSDIFFLAPTTMLIVTNRVKDALVEIRATNVRAELRS